METENERPNIRIEIPNQQMDVDESENEDGEIVDDESHEIHMIQQSPPRSVFTTGINIFDKEEQRKRLERAKRFALKPEEIHCFTDDDHEELRESLGITDNNENLIRFDTVHLLGTKDMLIEDILDYFAKYAPTEIECVDEQSCNIKWVENITAARAMFYTSRAVIGMPVREQVLVKDFLDGEEADEAHGKSILLKNRQVELAIDDILVPNSAKNKFKNAVEISEISIPIPPGYWRLGDKHPKAKCLLLRYAMKTDKKPYKIEYLAKYYRKMGNTKNASDPRQERGSIFDRNKDLPRGKNPWGNLARNWDKDAKFRETTPTSGETVDIKNSSLATRLGVKPRTDSENEVEIIEEETTVKKPKGRSMRMRMYADEEEERIKIRKAIQKLKNQSEKLKKEPRDLRTILSINNYREPVEVINLVEDDLGRKLKNRSRQIIFSIDRDPAELRRDRKENIKSDVRSVLNRRRARSRSPYDHRRGEHSHRHRDRSTLRRHESPIRRRSPLHRRHQTPERTVRYNRYSRYQEYDHSDEDSTTKPRSKVAVVIKKQKQPTVASTIWSKTQDSESEESSSSEEESSNSESEESGSSSEESESGSEESESGSSSSEEADSPRTRKIARPGFDYNAANLKPSSLRITMANDRYRRN